MSRQVISSGLPYETLAGYARAVRVGNVIEVAGTSALDDSGAVQHAGDAAAQTTFILEKIQRVLAHAEAALEDVVRTRIYVTDIRYADTVARAHGEVFGQIKPACTLVQVSALVDPALLVEIEATAIVSL